MKNKTNRIITNNNISVKYYSDYSVGSKDQSNLWATAPATQCTNDNANAFENTSLSRHVAIGTSELCSFESVNPKILLLSFVL